MGGYVFIGLLFGLTVGIVAFDKARRRARGQAAAIREPDWTDILIRTVLLNFIALPYYFFQTRGTQFARFMGLALFFLLFIVSFGVMMALTVADM